MQNCLGENSYIFWWSVPKSSKKDISIPFCLGGEGDLSVSLSELAPLEHSWCGEGGEDFGVGGADSKVCGIRLWDVSSGLCLFCSRTGLLLDCLVPFFAFLKRTEVRRPTPSLGEVGGLSEEETPLTVSTSFEHGDTVCLFSLGWSMSSSTSICPVASLWPLPRPLVRRRPRPPWRLLDWLGVVVPPVSRQNIGAFGGASPGKGDEVGQVGFEGFWDEDFVHSNKKKAN